MPAGTFTIPPGPRAPTSPSCAPPARWCPGSRTPWPIWPFDAHARHRARADRRGAPAHAAGLVSVPDRPRRRRNRRLEHDQRRAVVLAARRLPCRAGAAHRSCFPAGCVPMSSSARPRSRSPAGRIVYRSIGPQGAGYAVSDLQGAAHPLAEIGRGSRRERHRSPSTVARPSSCARTATPTGCWRSTPTSSPMARPSARARSSREKTTGRLRVARDRSVRIDLRCAAGCRGELRLVEQRHGRRERLVGRAAFVGDPGRVSVRPQIARWARARAGCRGGLRVAAVLFPHGAARRGLGFYRIVSRSRCRRTGGPPFRAPLPAPRP